MTETKKTAMFFKALFVSVLTITALVFSVSAQTNKATLSGSVTDTQGAVITDADVKVTNTATGQVRETKTNSEGFYEVPLLDIGTYIVTVSKTGFQTVKRENIVLQTATETTADVQLSAGEVTTEVTVTAEAPLVQSETSDRGSVVSGREVTELPLSGRNFTQLATLTPGVVRATNTGIGEARNFNNGDPRSGNGGPGGSNENGSTETSRFARSGGASISANGQRSSNNNFSLDGVDNNEPQFGTIGVFTNPDSIAEFKVSTSIPPAEIGRAAGAVITVTTKSGGNDFSGSLYYYGQNSALNAYSPVLKTKLGEQANMANPNPLQVAAFRKTAQQIHEFGGTIGGPIIRNRTFFFFDYLGQRNNLPFPSDTTVPTTGARTGNFSDFTGAILDPRTGAAFPGNIIPTARINPVGQKYLQAFPNPTRAIQNPEGRLDCCGGRPNFFTQRANREEINNYRVRLDHKFNDKNSINGSFNEQRLQNVRANLFPGNIPTAGFGAGEERGNTRSVTLNDVHIFNPTTLNEFRFGFTQIQISIFNCGVGGACGVSPTFSRDIGIPNSNDGSIEASGGVLMGAFGTGFQEFTGDGGLFQVKSKNPYFADTVTLIRGNHTIKTGFELRLRYLNTIDGGRAGNLKGQFQYGGNGPALGFNPACPAGSGTSSNPNGDPNLPINWTCYVRPDGVPYGGTGNATANILLGLPALNVGKGSVAGGPFNLRSQEWGFFVQDDWKVNDRLTLNLGLRYDLFTPSTEKDGRLSLYDVDQRKIIVANGGGDSIVETDKNNFGPRIGFSYAVNKEKSLILRGGYGLLYTLDATDYPPGIRNAPFSSSRAFDQIDWGGANGNQRVLGNFGIATGPPPVPAASDPNNIPNDLSVYALDLKQKTGLVNQFQLSLQYQFARNYSLDVAYVGNRSSNLLYSTNIGSGGLGIARNRAGNALGTAILYTNGAKSQYDSMQVQLQRRFSGGVQGQLSYTWSHTLDNSTGVFSGLGDQRTSRQGPIDPRTLDSDWGNSSLDTRHLLSTNWIIDLPFGKNKKFSTNNAVGDAIIGGWQMNWIVSARSGLPFSVVTTDGGLGRPSLIGDPYANVPKGKLLNRAAFSDSVGITSFTNAAGNTIRYGNLGRNTFRGPSLLFADMSLFKNGDITEDWRYQFGIEFYNVFNRANYTVPNNNYADAGGFGDIKYNAYAGRVIQYRFKLLF